MAFSCSREHYAAHLALHREWTAAIGTPGYDKAAWKERAQLLHAGCRGGCLVNPPPLEAEHQRRQAELLVEEIDREALARVQSGEFTPTAAAHPETIRAIADGLGARFAGECRKSPAGVMAISTAGGTVTIDGDATVPIGHIRFVRRVKP